MPPYPRPLDVTLQAGPGMMRGPGPTRMTTVGKNAVRKLAMSTQWWQDGLEPRKIDVSVGKIYTLLPRQKGQVLPLHSRLWRKLPHLTVPQLRLLLPKRHGAALPYQARDTMWGIQPTHSWGLGSLAGTIQ